MHYALEYMHNTHITINYCNLYPLIQTSWQPSLMPVCVYFQSGEQSQISWAHSQNVERTNRTLIIGSSIFPRDLFLALSATKKNYL